MMAAYNNGKFSSYHDHDYTGEAKDIYGELDPGKRVSLDLSIGGASGIVG